MSDSQSNHTVILKNLYKEVGGNPEDLEIRPRDKAYIVKKKNSIKFFKVRESEIEDEIFTIKIQLKKLLTA